MLDDFWLFLIFWMIRGFDMDQKEAIEAMREQYGLTPEQVIAMRDDPA